MKTNKFWIGFCALALVGGCATAPPGQVVSDTGYNNQYVAYGVVETITQSARAARIAV